MLEILFLAVPAIGGIGILAKKRGGSRGTWLGAALAGFVFCVLLVPGFTSFVSRWVWVGLVYVTMLLVTRRPVKLVHSWQCEECRAWNEPAAYICLCGRENPEAKVTA